MSNFSLNNIRRLVFHIDERDYWDMHLNEARTCRSSSDACTASYIDFSDSETFINGPYGVKSSDAYSYEGACNKGLQLDNIGLTGMDNGLIPFRYDSYTNEEFYELYTKSSYTIPSGDTSLHLHAVSGGTLQYEYPLSVEDGYVKLNGGFYQGFFRSADNYFVLPSTMDTKWRLSFRIRPRDYDPESDKTLNDKHPDNKGIFFYIGTRSENKWEYPYNGGVISGMTMEDCPIESEGDEIFDLVEPEEPLSGKTFETDNGFDVLQSNQDYIESDNKFLLYDRTCTGLKAGEEKGDEIALLETKRRRFNGNLFLYMDRTCSGYTVDNIEELEEQQTSGYTSLYRDIYNNAFALKVNDDGSIGYKYLIKDCDSDVEGNYSVISGSSFANIITKDEWNDIEIVMVPKGDKMSMSFYVNGKLKYVTSDIPMIDLHSLDDLMEKQEGVAYNISIGGGTQGLAEAIYTLPDFRLDKTYPIEDNFAGSFIGDIQYFRFSTC